MTTRDSLHLLLDRLTDPEIEALARIAREHGLAQRIDSGENGESHRVIDALRYPVLAAIWDNDNDAIFDEL